MLPLVGIPTALLWIIAVILAFVNTRPIAGIPHHTYTGILFGLAILFTVALILVGARNEQPRK